MSSPPPSPQQDSLCLITLMFFGEGLLFAGLGVPLALGRVPPNSTYGFRTARTLSDPAVWYAVNRSSGQDLIVAGVVIAVTAIAMASLLRGRPSFFLALANLAVSVVDRKSWPAQPRGWPWRA
jgi:uncharacterized membrane protein